LLLAARVLWILFTHNRLPDGGMTITFIMLCAGAGWIMSAIGLRDLARAKRLSEHWSLLGLFPGFAVVGLAIVSMLPARAIPQTAMPDGVRKTSPEGRSLSGSVLTALALYLLDAFVLNQGAIALVTAAVVIFVMLPQALMAAFAKERALLVNKAMKAAIYTVMVLAVLGSNHLNNRLAQHRAEALIAACKEYRGKYEKFPDKLEDLVPEFIPNVPLAKFTLLWNGFSYVSFEGQHGLRWVALPPFGRPSYHFEEDRWGYLD
jgi:amino acid transporter